MTTQTQITNANQSVSVPIKTKPQIWPFLLAAFLLLSLFSAAVLVFQSKGENLARNHRALESISARYQGMADLYAASIEPEAQQAESQRVLEILSLRYQGFADLYASRNKRDSYRALEIISIRYQAQADMYQAQEE